MISGKRKLEEWCGASANVCERAKWDCDKCNSSDKKWALEKKKKEESKKGGGKC